MSESTYTITGCLNTEDEVIVTSDHHGPIHIHRNDADPEHRFTAYRLAAGWFGNLPGDHPRAQKNN